MSRLLSEVNDKKMAMVEEYYFQVRQTEKYWDRDNLAALKIQSVYKMYRLREKFLRLRSGCIKLQTFFRRILATSKFLRRRELEVNKRNVA